MAERLTSASKPDAKIILEIGSGRYESGDDVLSDTIFTHWNSIALRRTFRPQDTFIGIDMGSRTSYRGFRPDEDAKMRQNWATLQARRPNEQLHFMQADMTKLPFADESVDEVIASNVFAIGSGADREQFPIIYEEANRVLKPDGTIVIFDNISPYFGRGLPPEVWMAEEGFAAPAHIDHVDPMSDIDNYMAVAEQYGLRVRSLSAEQQSQLKNPHEKMSDYDLRALLRQEIIWRLGKTTGRIVQPPLPQLPEPTPPKPKNILDRLRSFKRTR